MRFKGFQITKENLAKIAIDAAFVFSFFTASGLAQARRLSSIDLPDIKSHSQLDIVVTKGDRVHLKLVASELAFAFEWKFQNKMVCQIYECVIKTKNMNAGRNQVTALVYNDMGSREFTFKFEILEPAVDYVPKDIAPELVAASKLEEIDFSEDVVEKRTNNSMVFTESEKIILGKVPRNVRFGEKIETASDSEMTLKREGVYEIIFPKNTKADLMKSLSMKIVRLSSGAARVRALSEFAEFELEVMCGRKTIKVTRESDFYCRLSAANDGRAEIFNYRGLTKIKDEVNVSPPIELQGGENLTVDNLVETRSKSDPYDIFKASTPQYFLGAKSDRAPTFITRDLLELTKLGESESKKRARELLGQSDPILALETLLPKYKELKVDGEYNTLVGEAYIQLQFLEDAVTFLDRAVKLLPEEDRAHFLRAKAYFELKNCSKSLTSLKKVLDMDPSEDLALVLYETGYCQYEAAKLSQARLYLKTALWYTSADPLREKIQTVLRKIEDNSRLSLSGKTKLGYESNVTRTAKTHENPFFLEQLGSSLYYGSVEANYRPWATPFYKIDLGYEASMKGYLSNNLDDYGVSRHQLYSSFELESEIPGAGSDRFFAKVAPDIEIVSVGENRTGDSYSYSLEGGYKGKRSLRLWYESTTVVDPLPAANDYLDTFTNSAIVPSDRSMSIRRLGLQATAFQSGRFTTDIGLDQKTFTMSVEASNPDSRTDQDFSLLLKHSTSRSENSFKLGLITSSYAYDPDRKESGSYLGWTWTYLVTPLLSFDAEALYESFSSTEEALTFTNMSLTTGCTLDL